MLFQLLIKPNLNIESEMQKIGASVDIELAHTQVVTKTEIFIDGHGHSFFVWEGTPKLYLTELELSP